MMDISQVYKLLYQNFGPQGWWPTISQNKQNKKFEICAGAILTQNTSWQQVEKAIKNLHKSKALNKNSIQNISMARLASLIKPSGFYKQKAIKLKKFCEFLDKHPFQSLEKMSLPEARKILLEIYGIGPETADSILLYALNKPIFIIDAYTKRIFSRILPNATKNLSSYDSWQKFFEKELPGDAEIYKEFHALIVELAKNHCRKKSEKFLCRECPIKCR